VTYRLIPEPTMMSAQQRSVDQYFKAAANEWDEIYELDTLYARIHQERRRIVLSMAENVALPVEARVLEVGCGAGLATVALAESGYAVEAVDTVRDMLLTTRARAARVAVAHRIRVIQASADHLPYSDNQFGLVLALGVLPWLASIRTAMMEFIRVTRPGGFLPRSSGCSTPPGSSCSWVAAADPFLQAYLRCKVDTRRTMGTAAKYHTEIR